MEKKYFESNKKNWNERVAIHKNSSFYNIDRFLDEKESSLKSLELEELGDIKGKKILHLQCHFGMDTLSLARLGADVTGVDFSEKAIELANELSKKSDIEAKYICCNVFELDKFLNEEEKFDVVYASYGVFCWIPDLTHRILQVIQQ